jgi:hypothetical protein
MKIARQGSVGNEVRQRASKDLANNPYLAGWLLFTFSFIFLLFWLSERGKALRLQHFSRQRGRQRDSNGVGNGL